MLTIAQQVNVSHILGLDKSLKRNLCLSNIPSRSSIGLSSSASDERASMEGPVLQNGGTGLEARVWEECRSRTPSREHEKFAHQVGASNTGLVFDFGL